MIATIMPRLRRIPKEFLSLRHPLGNDCYAACSLEDPVLPSNRLTLL